MDDALFSLREANSHDKVFLDAYTYAEGMDYLPDLLNVEVAVNNADEPVGFIRINEGANGAAHVNPVVVHQSWRGYGVGRALIEHALDRYGELRLVARGPSRGFYERLGFALCDWDEIDAEVVEDCAHCELRKECAPQPMKRMSHGDVSLDS